MWMRSSTSYLVPAAAMAVLLTGAAGPGPAVEAHDVAQVGLELLLGM